MKRISKWMAALLALVMLTGWVPMGALSVSALGAGVTATSWEELRQALQDPAVESVTVSNTPDGTGAVAWDGVTDFIDYAYVCVAFESDVIRGDVTGDGDLTIADAMKIFNFVNEKIDKNITLNKE